MVSIKSIKIFYITHCVLMRIVDKILTFNHILEHSIQGFLGFTSIHIKVDVWINIPTSYIKGKVTHTSTLIHSFKSYKPLDGVLWDEWLNAYLLPQSRNFVDHFSVVVGSVQKNGK